MMYGIKSSSTTTESSVLFLFSMFTTLWIEEHTKHMLYYLFIGLIMTSYSSIHQERFNVCETG